MFNQYPYLNIQDLNLDYIMKAIREMRYEVTNFVSINAIKYADPIQWSITNQYEKNTIVIDPVTGTAYISVAPVPAGVALTRPEYWTVVFDLGSFVTRAAQNFTSRWESDTTLTATFPTNTGEWLVWGDVLYKALSNIIAGDTYVVGSNIEHFTIEDLYNAYLNTIASILAMVGDLTDLTTSDTSDIVHAINSVLADLNITIGDLADLTTTDKTSIVNAINELDERFKNYKIVNVLDYGVKGDGVTDDTAAINACIAQFANAGYEPFWTDRKNGVVVYFPSGRYRVSDSIILYPFIHIVGAGMGATFFIFEDDAPADSVMFKTWEFDSFINSPKGYYNPDGVPCDFSVSNATLFGQASTVTNGAAFNIYGYAYRLENIEIYYFDGDGIYVDYGHDPLEPYYMDDTKFYETVLTNIYIRQCGVRGIDWHGLTDACWDNVNVSECNAPVAVEIHAPIYVNELHVYGCGDSGHVSTGLAIHSNLFGNVIISENNTGTGVIITNNVWNVIVNTLEVYGNGADELAIEANCKNILIGQLLARVLTANAYAATFQGDATISSGIIRGENTTGASGLFVNASAHVTIDNLKIVDFSDGVGMKVGQGGANERCHINAIIENCLTAIETGAGLGGDCDIYVDIIRTATQTSLSWAFGYADTDLIYIREYNGSTWSVLNDIRPARNNDLRLGTNYQIQSFAGGTWYDQPFMRYASNHYEYYDYLTQSWKEEYPIGYVAWDSVSGHLVYYQGNSTWAQVPNL